MLKVKALKALFSVDIFPTQKLIKKKDATPINSQPKIKINQFEAHNSTTIEITKLFKKIINKTNLGSFLI